MRIAIEAQRIFRTKKHGMDMVALQLIRNLQELDHENEYFIFTAPGEDSGIIQETANFHIISEGPSIYPIWENVTLPRLCKKYKIDLLHCTSNTAPVVGSTPTMVTLHDVIFMESNVLFKKGYSITQRLGNIYRKWNLRLIKNKIKRWITVSDFEKKNIIRKMNFSSEEVFTVYNSYAEHFKSTVTEEQQREIKEKYQLPDRFMFFLGNTDPKKNTENLIKAFQMYTREVSQPLHLVVADLNLANVKEWINDSATSSLFHFPGYIANADLPVIFSMADLFLYPSKRESFGIPIVEAMASSCPVLTSNTSALPEIAGNGAAYCDPENIACIAAQIQFVLENDSIRKNLIEKGKIRSQQFSWKKSAEQILHHYHEVESQLSATKALKPTTL